MAILRKKEIWKMSEKERQRKLQDLKAEMMSLRAKVAMGGVIESPGRLRELRKTVARIQTISRMKELEIQE